MSVRYESSNEKKPPKKKLASPRARHWRRSHIYTHTHSDTVKIVTAEAIAGKSVYFKINNNLNKRDKNANSAEHFWKN